MSIFGDEPARQTPDAHPGEDLYGLSVAELDERIALYTTEIERLKVERDRKSKDNDAAHALFR